MGCVSSKEQEAFDNRNKDKKKIKNGGNNKNSKKKMKSSTSAAETTSPTIPTPFEEIIIRAAGVGYPRNGINSLRSQFEQKQRLQINRVPPQSSLPNSSTSPLGDDQEDNVALAMFPRLSISRRRTNSDSRMMIVTLPAKKKEEQEEGGGQRKSGSSSSSNRLAVPSSSMSGGAGGDQSMLSARGSNPLQLASFRSNQGGGDEADAAAAKSALKSGRSLGPVFDTNNEKW